MWNKELPSILPKRKFGRHKPFAMQWDQISCIDPQHLWETTIPTLWCGLSPLRDIFVPSQNSKISLIWSHQVSVKNNKSNSRFFNSGIFFRSGVISDALVRCTSGRWRNSSAVLLLPIATSYSTSTVNTSKWCTGIWNNFPIHFGDQTTIIN